LHASAPLLISIDNVAAAMTARMAKDMPSPNGTTEIEPTMTVGNVNKIVAYMAPAAGCECAIHPIKAANMPFIGRR
jgi:hypothetical protein